MIDIKKEVKLKGINDYGDYWDHMGERQGKRKNKKIGMNMKKEELRKLIDKKTGYKTALGKFGTKKEIIKALKEKRGR